MKAGMRDGPEAEPSHAVLLARALSGDRDALGALLGRHAGAAHAAILSRHGPGQELEDLVQESLRRAVAGIGELREPGRVGPWLYGIALRVSSESLRRRRRSPRSLEFLPADPAAPTPGEDRLKGLEAALDRLVENDREALTMHYLEGMDYEAMAALLGLTKAGVAQRLSRARVRLRRKMEGAS